MQTDREILAKHYETRKALKELEKSGWPEWEKDGTRFWLSHIRSHWMLQYLGALHVGGWVDGMYEDDHTAVCIIERDIRLKLEKRDVAIEMYSGLYVARKGLSHLLTNGKWRLAVRRTADLFPTYDAALMAALAATEKGA